MKNDNCVKNYTTEREEKEKMAEEIVERICRMTPEQRKDFFRKMSEILSAE